MASSPQILPHDVSRVLQQLQSRSLAPLPSPEGITKRASVALVLRVQPNPEHCPVASAPLATAIDDFFARDWVQHGELEALFIKRTSRERDRWTGHVALPGGKRDLDDDSDLAAAVRETFEEVGLDLQSSIQCGKLPDRIVATSWGTVPLMVLCPFVFLNTSPNIPSLQLQPTEVASAHWVPVSVLLAPEFRTTEKCDVSDRLARRTFGLLGRCVRMGLRASLGKMEFAAIRLWPSQSHYSTFARDFLVPAQNGKWESPLVCWGLTLGVIEDFLEMLPPLGKSLELWKYPTFTAWDVRAVTSLMTWSLRRRNWQRAIGGRLSGSQFETRQEDESDGECAGEEGKGIVGEDIGESGILVTGKTASADTFAEGEPISSVGILLEGYYDVVRKSVWITLAGRAVIGAIVIRSICKAQPR